jgi:hypothetical protein
MKNGRGLSKICCEGQAGKACRTHKYIHQAAIIDSLFFRAATSHDTHSSKGHKVIPSVSHFMKMILTERRDARLSRYTVSLSGIPLVSGILRSGRFRKAEPEGQVKNAFSKNYVAAAGSSM